MHMSAFGDPVPTARVEPYYTWHRPLGCTCPSFWWGILPPPCPIHNPPPVYSWPPTITTNHTVTFSPIPSERPEGEAMRADEV